MNQCTEMGLRASTVSAIAVLAILNGVIADDWFITMKSGRRLMMYDLQAGIGHASSEKAKRIVFEISDFMLAGHDLNMNLRRATMESVVELGQKDAPLVFDEDMNNEGIETGYMRIGKNYSVLHAADDTIVGVWGPGLTLTPLHTEKHPGIYINIASSRERRHGIQDGNDYDPGFLQVETKQSIERKNESSNENDTIGYASHWPRYTSSHQVSSSDAGLKVRSTARQNIASEKCRLGKISKKIRIAAVADNLICSRFGGNAKMTALAVRGVIFLANQPYLRQTCLKLVVRSVEVQCKPEKDPYRKFASYTDAFEVLKDLQLFWNKKRTGVKRDLTFYMAGFILVDKFIGYAYTTSVCHKERAYGYAEDLDIWTVAHEIGHMLGCPHYEEGVMVPNEKDKAMYFHVQSVTAINDFVDKNSQSKCLARAPKPSGKCTNGFSKDEVFICSSWTFGSIFSLADNSIRVDIIMAQEYQHLKITFQASPGVKISELSFLLAYREVLYPSEVPRRKVFSAGRSKIVVRVPLSSIRFPYNSKSCCDPLARLIMRPNIIFYQNKNDKMGGTFAIIGGLKCGSCETNRISIPSSLSRKCASCQL